MRPSARLCPCSAPLRRWWGVGALVPSRALLVPLRGGGGGGALPSPPRGAVANGHKKPHRGVGAGAHKKPPPWGGAVFIHLLRIS